MKATQFEFRFRFFIILLIYVVGFWAPWTWTSGRYAPPPATAWLALRDHAGALGLAAPGPGDAGGDGAGDSLRACWARCCAFGARRFSSASIVHSGPMLASSVMAAGPYRYVRNPLYLGSWFLGLSIAILMPPSGALVFARAAGAVLLPADPGRRGFSHRADRRGVSGVHDARCRGWYRPCGRGLRSRAARPQWLMSLVAEFLPVSYPLCLAVAGVALRSHCC